MSLISIKDVYKIYNVGDNEVRALDGISIKIDDGEFVAIVGSSGSGKSTLMNMLGCLDIPTSGTYELGGQDTSCLTDDQLSHIRNQRIGFIFQGFNLINTLNAEENVELPLIYRRMPKIHRRDAAKSALQMVGLSERMHHKPSEMSGGQQQRVAIARAIAAQPDIILADEPTGNLDSRSGADVMDILMDLNKGGKTILLITHDESIAALAHRRIKIADGRVECEY